MSVLKDTDGNIFGITKEGERELLLSSEAINVLGFGKTPTAAEKEALRDSMSAFDPLPPLAYPAVANITNDGAQITLTSKIFEIADGWNRSFGDIVYVPEKSMFLVVYRKGSDHIGGDDGESWGVWVTPEGELSGDEFLIYSPSSGDGRSPAITRLRDGRLVIWQLVTIATRNHEQKLLISEDGENWTVRNVTHDSGQTDFTPICRMIEASNGEWWLPGYHFPTDPADPDHLPVEGPGYLVTTDEGETECTHVQIANNADIAGSFMNETSIHFNTKDGVRTYRAFVRDDGTGTTDVMQVFDSVDEGATWTRVGGVAQGTSEGVRPSILPLVDGGYIYPQRFGGSIQRANFRWFDDTFSYTNGFVHVLDHDLRITYNEWAIGPNGVPYFVAFLETNLADAGVEHTDVLFGKMEEAPRPRLEEISGLVQAVDSESILVPPHGFSAAWPGTAGVQSRENGVWKTALSADYLEVGDIGDFNFLHDNSADWFLAWHGSRSASSTCGIFGTCANDTAEEGVLLQSASGAFTFRIYNGVAKLYEKVINGIFDGTPTTLGIWFIRDDNRLVVYRGRGALSTSTDLPSAGFGAGNHADKLAIGSIGAGALALTQDFYRMSIISGTTINPADIEKSLAWVGNA